MKSNLFNATAQQALDLANNDNGIWIEVLREQPPKEYEYSLMSSHRGITYVHFIKHCKQRNRRMQIKLRYFPGMYKVKGTDLHIKLDTTVKRVQELTSKEIELMGIKIVPHLPFVINPNTPKDKLDKLILIVAQGELANYWNSLHAKPVRTKDGKGWVCYPYSSFLDVIDAVSNKNFCGEQDDWYWKGEPLEICPDPWIAAMAWEKVSK